MKYYSKPSHISTASIFKPPGSVTEPEHDNKALKRKSVSM